MKKAKSILALLMAFAMLMSFAVTGSAAADAVAAEKELNNDFKTATAFGFATKIKGVLGTATDVDYFTFTADAEGLATVTLAHDEIVDASKDAAYFAITVYDASEKEVAAFRSTGAEKETVSPSFAVSAKATYFVVVEMASIHSDILEYTIIASFDKNALTEKEPNNQAATATNLELSTSGSSKSYYGTIASEGKDVDFYRVAPAKDGVIYLYLYNGNIPSDFKATLYTHYEGVNGVLLEEEVASITIDSNTEYAKSVAIGVYGKEYMLKVEGINGKTGGYRTRVFYQAVSDAEKEYNDAANLYNSLTVGKPLRGTIAQNGDVDFYSFKAAKDNAGYKISIALADDKAPKTGSWNITVTEGKTQNIVSKVEKVEIKADKPAVISIGVLPTDRNYYIKVEQGGTLTTEIYKINVEALTPAAGDNTDNNEDQKSFGEQIKEYFNKFWGNFSEWVDEVNFIGILMNLLPSIGSAMPTLFTWIISLFG